MANSMVLGLLRDSNNAVVVAEAPADTALSSGGADVAVADTLVIAANATRQVISLSNGSDTAMWITLASVGAAVGNGYYLPPGGSRDFAYQGAVCAVHAGAVGTKRIGTLELG